MRALRLVALGVAVAASSGFAQSVTPVFAQAAAPAAEPPIKMVALTQANIDGFLAAQKDLRAVEGKQPATSDDKPDPKADAARAAIVKKDGFADMNQFVDVSATIGAVMLGIDPDTKAYVGQATVIKKQIADVQADKKISAKDKKDTLEELNETLKSASPDKPSQANIDLVAKNFETLSDAVEGE